MLSGDAVEDDSGSYAAFTEQGSSASHLTAAKVLDVVPGLPDCAGEARNMPSNWIRTPQSRSPKSWDKMTDPVVPLERNLCGHPSTGLLWEQRFRWKKDGGQNQDVKACMCIEQAGYFNRLTWMI